MGQDFEAIQLAGGHLPRAGPCEGASLQPLRGDEAFSGTEAALRCGPGPAFIGINLDWETCAHFSKRVSRKQSPFFLLGKPHPSLRVFPLIVRGNLRVT